MMINTRIALKPSKENKTTSFHEQNVVFNEECECHPAISSCIYIHRTSKRNELKWFFFSLKEGQNRTTITITAAEATATAAGTKTNKYTKTSINRQTICFKIKIN